MFSATMTLEGTGLMEEEEKEEKIDTTYNNKPSPLLIAPQI
jgi:hypothetical protein